MFGGESEEDREQEYEYKAIVVDSVSKGVFSIGGAKIQDVLDDHAEDGWRFINTIEQRGKTSKLVFEREYKSD